MKKFPLLAIALFLFSSIGAQAPEKPVEHKKDSIVTKSDTVYVPVYIFFVDDTVSVTVAYKKKATSEKTMLCNGYAVFRGPKVSGKKEFVDNPKLIAVLDERKKPLKHIVKVF